MNPSSEQENYYKLDNILLSCSHNMRRALRQRWKLQTSKDWEEGMDIEQILTVTGRKWYRQAPGFQKTAMETTGIEEWDIALLSLVIKNVGDGKKYEEENRAIEELKQIRNQLAHHSTKKVPKTEFDCNVEKIRGCLKFLGVRQDTIEKIISRAGITSSIQAHELMTKIHKKADAFYADCQLEEAINLYGKAIEIPSLLPENLGKAYEKRANCFLKTIKDPLVDDEKCNQALIDVTKALGLNNDSWAAHYIAAQCYRWKSNFPKALYHFNRSLAISPVQRQVKNDFESCKLLAGEYTGGGHFSPSSLYMNLEECLLDLEDQSGFKKTEEEFFYEREDLPDILLDGQGDAFRGHKYFYGWNIKQDFKEAAKYYARSASVKNTEGMYNIARCYNYGYGLKQDFSKAFEIIRELAGKDKKSVGLITPYKCNHWIATAMYSLGLMYDEGTGVAKDFQMAAKWFLKAMENGNGGAAHRLGQYYYEGHVVPRDRKMAELCWRQALNLRHAMSTSPLMMYYIEELEPVKAMFMFRIGREMANQNLQNMSDEYLNLLVTEAKTTRDSLEPDLRAFETEHQLDAKELTFSERMKRSIPHAASNSIEAIERCRSTYRGQPESWGGKFQRESWHAVTILMIAARALNGSETASRIIQTLEFGNELESLLKDYNERDETFEHQIFILYYKCATLEHHLTPLTHPSFAKLKRLIASLYEEKCDVKGDADMKIRFCFAYLNLEAYAMFDDMFMVEVLKEGISRYPGNPHYYNLLVNVYEAKQMCHEAIKVCDEGLQKCPSDMDLLYVRACNFRKDSSINMNIAESVQIYHDFLDVAPKDHRKYPEAYYGICGIYLTQEFSANRENHLELIRLYFQQGQDAEKNQLPCYLPYGESETKFNVKNILDLMENSKVCGQKNTAMLERKKYLKSPIRRGTFLVHRQNLKNHTEMLKMFDASSDIRESLTSTPKLNPVIIKNASLLKPITLVEINPNRDNIFENRIIELTIVDDPNPHYPSIHMVAEDDNGDIIQLFVYNVDREKETLEKFQAGCRIAVMNPYLRIGAHDRTVGIRVDDPACIVYLTKRENMCRFCCDENAVQKCSRCKRPYCSKECQTLDWKLHRHKLICGLNSAHHSKSSSCNFQNISFM